MVKINRLITNINRTKMSNKKIEWLVIHYVGAVSSAKANANYFYAANRQASANYFVDENEIWQVVEDKDAAWHVGAEKYYNACRNINSIGIEICCKKDSSYWYFEPKAIENAIELTKMLMKKYNIPIERVVRHYDVTHKICPEPFIRNIVQWLNFKNKLVEDHMADIPEVSLKEKEEKIKEFYSFDDNTIKFFEFYRYNIALIDKLYNKAKNSEK